MTRTFPEELINFVRQDDTEAAIFEITRLGLDVNMRSDAASDYEGADQRVGTTLLIEAARNGAARTFKALLQLGADVNECGADGQNPLIAAVAFRENEIVRLALRARALTGPRDNAGLNALDHACRSRDAALVELLLAAGADPNEPDINGNTPIIVAVVYDNVSTVLALLAVGVRVNETDCSGLSALARVNWQNDVMVAALLDAGADPNGRLEDGAPLLLKAVSRAPLDVLQMLFDKGALVPPDEALRCNLRFAAAFNKDPNAAELIEGLCNSKDSRGSG